MVAEKVIRFQGKNKDLQQLSQQISQQLQSEGYKTQSKIAPLGTVIQAQKAGILRDIIAADRAFTILIAGQPSDFTIHIGIGNWIKNLTITTVETLFLSALFLAIDVPEMFWTQHVENGLVKEVTQIVNEAPQIENISKVETPQTVPQTVPISPATQGICNVCGYQNDATANFCVKCGTKLK